MLCVLAANMLFKYLEERWARKQCASFQTLIKENEQRLIEL